MFEAPKTQWTGLNVRVDWHTCKHDSLILEWKTITLLWHSAFQPAWGKLTSRQSRFLPEPNAAKVNVRPWNARMVCVAFQTHFSRAGELVLSLLEDEPQTNVNRILCLFCLDIAYSDSSSLLSTSQPVSHQSVLTYSQMTGEESRHTGCWHQNISPYLPPKCLRVSFSLHFPAFCSLLHPPEPLLSS